MNCIFCKNISDNSKSVEHILPESLGNNDHILRKGIVCDACNNYFATKVEKIVLDKPYFKNVRYRNFITTKKGRLVPGAALFPNKSGGWVEMWLDGNGFILNSKDQNIIEQIQNGTITSVIIPIVDKPEENDYDVSRFLAKVGLELLASRIAEDDEWINEIVTKTELDPIRNYARYGTGAFWKYHQRRIYNEDDRFVDPVNHPEPYEILHEFDFLYTETGILYFVMTIMGIEFAINLADSETDFYIKWLEENNGVSPIKRYTEYMIKRDENASH